MTTDNDISKRRRVLELTHQLADLAKDVGERYVELRDIGVQPGEIESLVIDHVPISVREEVSLFAPNITMMAELIHNAVKVTKLPYADQQSAKAAMLKGFTDSAHVGDVGLPQDIVDVLRAGANRAAEDPGFKRSRMEKHIDRLFESAPKVATSDTPALDCQVVLRSGMPLVGALSKTEDGLLKMLVPTQGPNNQTVMAEAVFEYEDVLTLIQVREMKMERGSLISRLTT